jgi:hypothetical protein
MIGLTMYTAVCSALFYLGSRALITSWLWRRYPTRFARFADCAACTGAWYGLACSLVLGRLLGVTYLGLDPREWSTHIVVALASITTTPIGAGLQQWGFEKLGDAMTETE